MLLLENIFESVDAVLDRILGRMTINKGRAIKVIIMGNNKPCELDCLLAYHVYLCICSAKPMNFISTTVITSESETS